MMLNAILNRRSIRKYRDVDVPEKMIEEILRAGILAPSSKNSQPWKFVVVSGAAKSGMLAAMERGLAREKLEPMLQDSRRHIGGAEHTLEIMRQAPVTVFVLNMEGTALTAPLTAEGRVYEICNAQSIGAAIENMTLAATELGLGSLWICDTFFAHRELCNWLDEGGELAAALALGYADENPDSRPRKKISDVVEWRR